ncbi:MAG: DUF2612 domain-containing protein [Burkholderiaceae bacterium]|jgi:hypothetical protein|nr:DUF2612 domain-containing protein [Burkholderiaceae bacterium]
MKNVERTIISQYANSPTLVQLVRDMDRYIDPQADLKDFYDFVWNVMTARSYGLDVWGKIVDIRREIHVDVEDFHFGYSTGEGIKDWTPFNDKPFWTPSLGETYSVTLEDEPYRRLILTKALANISATTAPAINRLMTKLFEGRGKCYVLDNHDMTVTYAFEFYLEPYERAIIRRSGVFIHSAGVDFNILEIPANITFGFDEAHNYATFDDGTFYFGA